MAAPINIGQIFRVFGRLSTEEVAIVLPGVTPSQYDVLEVVFAWMENPDSARMSAARIARSIQVSPSTAKSLVGQLTSRGFLRQDAAGSQLLTASGEELLKKCRSAQEGIEAEWRECMSSIGVEILEENFVSFLEGTRA